MKTILVFVLLAGMTCAAADNFKTPEAVVEKLQQLNSSPCDLDCQIEIAGLYSDEFLASQRRAIMFGLQNEAQRAYNASILFGENFTLAQLDAMSDAEFFARQLLNVERSVPPEFRFKTVKLTSKKVISESEVSYLTHHSGMSASPKHFEQSITTLIRGANGWRIKH